MIPKLEKLEHHSVADWDFESIGWELSTLQFVSPPSSLRRTGAGRLAVLSRKSQALNLPQGAIITQVRPPAIFTAIAVFRSQCPFGVANSLNNYSIRTASAGYVALWRTVAGAATALATWNAEILNLAWQKLRLTWWSGYDPQNTPALNTKLEKWVAGAWISYGVLYDTQNLWANSLQNRCGIEMRLASTFIDDTEIWVPV